MKVFLNAIFSVVDTYCPPSSRIDVSQLNKLDKELDYRREFKDRFPNSPHSPGFMSPKKMSEMINEAKKLGPIEFYCNVKNNGKWDFKRLGDRKEYENFGNYSFGIVAEANGWNEHVRDLLVGIVQIKTGTSKPEWIFSETFGDDPNDHKFITTGVNDYTEYLSNKNLERESSKDIYREHICKPKEEDEGDLLP